MKKTNIFTKEARKMKTYNYKTEYYLKDDYKNYKVL